MKIVKEHNEMTEGLEAKKRALLAQLEMVCVFLFTPFYIKKKYIRLQFFKSCIALSTDKSLSCSSGQVLQKLIALCARYFVQY